MSATASIPLMTADEFLQLYGDESGVELVDGEILRIPMPGGQHGKVCFRANYLIGNYVVAHNLGWVAINDTFIRTRKNPDGCRGADILFISYETLPADQPFPVGALTPPIDLVVEVRSPYDSINELTAKATEYIGAGVRCVLLIDPKLEVATVLQADEYPLRYHNGDELTFPDILPGFAVRVREFFS